MAEPPFQSDGTPTPAGGTGSATPRPAAAFMATRWTLVVRAQGESAVAREALGTLCEAYYAPVAAFVRARVGNEEAARDLTQEFFARVLQGGALDAAAPGRGRFRSYLLGAVKHFLADMRDRGLAAKRGGGVEPVPIEAGTDTSPGFEPVAPAGPAMELQFDRQWAFTLLDRALRTLEAEFRAAGKGGHFEVLKPWLTGAEAGPQSEAATRLGLNENAVKVAIHRLRARFRELVKAEIAVTVDDPAEGAIELAYLIEVVAAGGRS